MRHILLCVILWVSGPHAGAQSSTQSSDIDNFDNEYLSRPAHRIEGRWLFMADDIEIGIRQSAADANSSARIYDILLIYSPDRSMVPGTRLGTLRPTAAEGVYECSLESSVASKGLRSRAADYTVTLTDADNRLIFKGHRSKVRFDPWRLLPYPLRSTIRRSLREDPTFEGCLRVFPEPDRPANPLYF